METAGSWRASLWAWPKHRRSIGGGRWASARLAGPVRQRALHHSELALREGDTDAHVGEALLDLAQQLGLGAPEVLAARPCADDQLDRAFAQRAGHHGGRRLLQDAHIRREQLLDLRDRLADVV